MKFVKMQGCGNDYVYINGFEKESAYYKNPEIIKALSDRHFGIGSDGVIFINPSDKADFEMEMYNADGSYSEMCGNGIRCVAKFVYDEGLTDKTEISVISGGKIKYLSLNVSKSEYLGASYGLKPASFNERGMVVSVRVNMGSPEFDKEKIDEPITIGDKTFNMTRVSMGNPHAVVFTDDPDTVGVEKYGRLFEVNEAFPNRTNTEFAKIIDREHIYMRVWERGSGETLACGTGCCATAVAAVLNGLTERKVLIKVLGGELLIEWDEKDNTVYMTGPAVCVFRGEINK